MTKLENYIYVVKRNFKVQILNQFFNKSFVVLLLKINGLMEL